MNEESELIQDPDFIKEIMGDINLDPNDPMVKELLDQMKKKEGDDDKKDDGADKKGDDQKKD